MKGPLLIISSSGMLTGGRIIRGFNGVDFKWKGEVIFSEALSSHADQNELIEWTGNPLPM